mgnify:FL=1
MLLQAQNVNKDYGHISACSDICLSLEEGQVFGLLGPNGAGKSTLVKIFLGLVRPSSGQVYIKGRAVSEVDSRRDTGYLPELFRLYEWLTALDFLRLNARLYGVAAREEKRAVQDALELVGLKDRSKDKIQGYSKGMQQRLALAAAVVHRPVLLFLDEPTSALDPVGRREVRDIIRRLNDEGTTIFLNSHLLSEVEMTCSQLGFIKKGRLIAAGRIEEFMQESREIKVEADEIDLRSLHEWQQEGKLIDSHAQAVTLQVESRDEIAIIVKQLVDRGARVYRVDAVEKGLEDVFMNLMKA